jgi:hypothetical protein
MATAALTAPPSRDCRYAPPLPRRLGSGVSGSPSRQSPCVLASGTLHTGQRLGARFSLPSCLQWTVDGVRPQRLHVRAGAISGEGIVNSAASELGAHRPPPPQASPVMRACRCYRWQQRYRSRRTRTGSSPRWC